MTDHNATGADVVWDCLLPLAVGATTVAGDPVARVALFSRIPRPGVGDLVQRNIFLRLLKEAYPAATLSWIVGDYVTRFRFHDDLVRRHCLADEVIICPDAEEGDSPRWRRFAGGLAEHDFDVAVVDPRSLGLGVAEAHRARIHRRVAVPDGGRDDDLISHPIILTATGTSDLYDYTRALAVAVDHDLRTPPHEIVPRLLLHPESLPAWTLRRPLVGVHPGCSRGWNRRWPLASFSALAVRLAERCYATLVVLGSPDEGAEAALLRDAVLDACPRAQIHAAVGEPLNHVAHLIDRMDLLVGNDSGPAHLAAALATPTVVIYGTDGEEAMWRRVYPHHVGVNKHYPCQNRDNEPPDGNGQCALGCPCDYIAPEGPYPRCLTDITVDEVWHAVQTSLVLDT